MNDEHQTETITASEAISEWADAAQEILDYITGGDDPTPAMITRLGSARETLNRLGICLIGDNS